MTEPSSMIGWEPWPGYDGLDTNAAFEELNARVVQKVRDARALAALVHRVEAEGQQRELVLRASAEWRKLANQVVGRWKVLPDQRGWVIK